MCLNGVVIRIYNIYICIHVRIHMICYRYPIGLATYELSDTVVNVNVKKTVWYPTIPIVVLLEYRIGVIHIDMDSMSGYKFNP